MTELIFKGHSKMMRKHIETYYIKYAELSDISASCLIDFWGSTFWGRPVFRNLWRDPPWTDVDLTGVPFVRCSYRFRRLLEHTCS